MRITGTLRSDCEDGKSCPKVLDTDDPDHVLVQGDRVSEQLHAEAGVPAHETLTRVPRTLVDARSGDVRMDLDTWHRWYDEHLTRDLLRVETLDFYEPDAPSFARWQSGEHREPDWPAKTFWKRIRTERAAGILRRRVRIVRGPLTEYVRYECQWGYHGLAEHGEEIRILDLTDHPLALAETGDFSVFDHEHAIRMHYGPGGEPRGATWMKDSAWAVIALRDLVWERAEPFAQWWARHPEHHRLGFYPH